jgi:hypothetical protein
VTDIKSGRHFPETVPVFPKLARLPEIAWAFHDGRHFFVCSTISHLTSYKFISQFDKKSTFPPMATPEVGFPGSDISKREVGLYRYRK